MTDFENRDSQGAETAGQQPAVPAPEQPAQAVPPQPESPAPQPAEQPAQPQQPGAPVPHLTIDPNEADPYQGEPFHMPEPPRAPEPPRGPEYEQPPQYDQPSQYEQPSYGAPQYGAPQYGYPQYQPPQYNQAPQQNYYQPQYTTPPAGYVQKSRLAAGLLGILLGTLGIHNFYLGFTSRAVIQLLVSIIGGIFTCGMATIAIAIWGFVEGVLLLIASPSRMYDGHGVLLRD